MACRLVDLTTDMQSKKMGLFGFSLAITFTDIQSLEHVKSSDALGNAALQKLYDLDAENILSNGFVEAELQWRAMVLRRRIGGLTEGPREQTEDQHVKLENIILPTMSQSASAGMFSRQDQINVGMDIDQTSVLNPGPTPFEAIQQIWNTLSLPSIASDQISFTGQGPGLPSSFRIGLLAQTAIGLSSLTASLLYATRNIVVMPNVRVDLRHACAEFKSESLYRIFNKPNPELWGPVGGLHPAADGHVRIHDGFPHHRIGALRLLGLPDTATREQVSAKTRLWRAIDLETAAADAGLVISALRTFEQWDLLSQARALPPHPVSLRPISAGLPFLPPRLSLPSDRPLQGLRVLDLSRVIAAPVATRTLAALGADVIWVTSPRLPDLPAIDPDTSRGKRRAYLDLDDADHRAVFVRLLVSADVVVQAYRPGALEANGFGPGELSRANPNLVYASLSAWGEEGPWKGRRGFDSLVQTCMGFNAAEARAEGKGKVAKVLPCQALDHAAGYLLAGGIMAAVWRRAIEGGSWRVDVSLAGVGKYLRGLGRYDGTSGFECEGIREPEDVEDLLEVYESDYGVLKAVRCGTMVQGAKVGWERGVRVAAEDRLDWL